MSVAKQILSSRKTGQEPGGGLYVDDVFSSYVRRGNGASDTVISGQDLANDGGMVWTKGRSGTYGATDHYLFHTARGTDIFLSTNTTNGQGAFTAGTSLNSFNNNGFTLGASPYVNDSATDFVAWVFKNSPRFYGHQVVTKVAGTSKTVNFPELVTLGMVRVRKIDGTGSWYVWHRSLSAGQLLIGESAAAAATLGHVTVSGTTVTLNNGVIADGQYLVEAFAHDTALDGIVQCGSLSGDGAAALGWEPQLLLIKRIDAIGGWRIIDSSRGFSMAGFAWLNPGGTSQELFDLNSPVAEFVPTATGFRNSGYFPGTWIYIAIRRPNKPPTSGTQVYNAIARAGTSAAANVAGAGFPPDLTFSWQRGTGTGSLWHDRLRGATKYLWAASSGAEGVNANGVTAFGMDGISVGSDGSVNQGSMIHHLFRRAPGFMDEVPWTGAGVATPLNHGLTVKPELIISKSRSMVQDWYVNIPDVANTLSLNTNGAWSTTAARTATATTFVPVLINNSERFVAYLFATLPGISKVGSYTGNGGSQPIACGFTTGARFVLAKRIDAAGDWFVWDTARGILPANDPHLSLNSTNAEVTTDDSIDPDSAGFIVNQNSATNINVLGGSYIFLAIA